ncbi:ribonuclease R [Sterolibacterium denitrificans]|uniref:ribonuclease R n=1 Tax=Sterolibacterium denitrificans TaxID=157592 RepID=UPI0012B68E39|nr:ribonuclease R [Sterolibacterium denitrificans]
MSRIRRADPHFSREIAKYEHPLPSREYILDTLEKSGVPLEFARICAALDVRSDELEIFRRRLDAMARAGQVVQNRAGAWLLPAKAALIHGRIEGHPDGYGFLIPDDKAEHPADIFLSPREMEAVLHGDSAMVRLVGVDRRGRPEGKIVRVTERGSKRVIGRVFNEHGVWFVVAENRRISQDILLAPAEKGGKLPAARAGQVVMVEIIQPPSAHAQPIGRIVEIIGNYADPGMEIEIALRKHVLPFEFSDAALATAGKLPQKVRKADWQGREDITRLPLVTIDGETARDFDDAVYCERLPGNGNRAGLFRLLVAIADVSHYVQAEDPLDLDARERGNSVYFPRRVIPMLPEKLSNGLCSLNPQVERLCMVCDMQITSSGHIDSYRFYPAVMHSHARLTYTEVAAALYDKDAAARGKLAALLPQLENLDALYRALAKARSKRGAIDFETLETEMIFDDNGKIARIVGRERNEAHRLIEECMLAANVCASAFLEKHKHPALFRVHEGPTADRLQRLREFLAGFGLQLGGGESPGAKDYAQLLGQLAGRPDKALLQTVMLRSLRQAQYSPGNLGHFGLAYDAYTHFTSPIRRYPDLLIHRAIKAVLHGRKYQPHAESAPGAGTIDAWEKVGLHCSMTERRADEATRDVEAWLKCYYMQDRIGEEFDGSISAVVPFGLFVALDDIHIEGLLHVSDLGADYFHYDEAGHVMVGERTGRRYRLADRVRVQVVRADLETNKIDFRLAAGTGSKPASQPAQSAQNVQNAQSKRSGKTGAKPQRITPMPEAKQVAPDAAIRPSRAPSGGSRKSAKSAKTTTVGKAKPAKTAKSAKAGKSAKPAKASTPSRGTRVKKGNARG